MSAAVFTNGTIRLDAWSDPVEALAVEHGTVLKTGTVEEVEAAAGPAPRRINLDGATVIPGLIESHVHPVFFGLTRNWTDCRSPLNGSIADVQAALRGDLGTLADGKWLRGWGYDDTLLAEARHLRREDLDAVSRDVPIVVSHISGHFVAANSRALELAGIHEDRADPSDGRFVRDETGKLTGLMWEMGAVHAVLDAMPQASAADVREAALYSLEVAAERGMTSIHDLGVGIMAGDLEIETWRKLAAESRLPIRVTGYVRSDLALRYLEKSPDLFSQPAMGKYRVAGAKFWSDGSIQGLSGALKEPYSCLDTECGELLYSPEELAGLLRRIDDAGGQCAVHANGDLAISTVAQAFATLRGSSEQNDPRHRVEHLQMASAKDIASLVASGSVASIFANHVYYWGDRHRDRFIGATRAARIDPTRDAQDGGLHFGMHSDCPITPMDALATFRTSVTRLTSGGSVLGEAQRLDPRAALHALTADSAYLTHDEAHLGTLTAGMDADLTILDQDIVGLSIEQSQNVSAVATVVGGEFVFNRAGF
ncbi:hydrolase [Arthrobacter livingstonensis]|uniref:Hydrolase n=1 Tax=Arthrobacter livingstonensis TaxID=670078 RepID=A0A2V5L3K9_9MICC|nr:amidohydrolase [Arthrobacter livingstonensis]PYI65708.1 hydrolase [Arthrobacter livingstonensis]